MIPDLNSIYILFLVTIYSYRNTSLTIGRNSSFSHKIDFIGHQNAYFVRLKAVSERMKPVLGVVEGTTVLDRIYNDKCITCTVQ